MNLREIKELIRMVDNSGLSEFQLEQDDIKLTLKKEVTIRQIKTENVPEIQVREIKSEIASEKIENTKPEEDLHIIKSPIVGVFYSSPNPDLPSYVKVGDRIKTGDVLCIVEAMKLMNEITSDTDGEIVEIVVHNQSPVEYGQPLFKIRKV